MINKDQSMMSIPGQDLAQRGAVVRLPITPKVLARGTTTAAILTKVWSIARQFL